MKAFANTYLFCKDIFLFCVVSLDNRIRIGYLFYSFYILMLILLDFKNLYGFFPAIKILQITMSIYKVVYSVKENFVTFFSLNGPVTYSE